MTTPFLAQLINIVERESRDGIQLVKNPNDNPICSLSYDTDAKCVTIVWRTYATSSQLRFVHEMLLQIMVQYKADRILGDDSDLPVVHAEDQKWIVEDWPPRAKRVGLKTAASSLSMTFFGKLSIASIQSKSAKDITVRTFPSIHLARPTKHHPA